MSRKVRLSSKEAIINVFDPIHVVVGIIKHENKILVGKRPEGKSLSGYFEFPGGKIEAGESSLAALKRELQEELDIEVTQATFWFTHSYTYPDITVLLDVWIVNAFLGEPKSQENQMLKWLSRDALKQHPFLEGNTPIIEQLINHAEE